MRFLIDECLTPDLVSIANNAGYEAHHVTRIGKQSEKDWKLVPYAIENDFVVVTRNSRDFRGEDGKAGFLTQDILDLINQVLEVDCHEDEVTLHLYEAPSS